MEKAKVIVSIPCYNDAELLESTVEKISQKMLEITSNFVIVIVEDVSDSMTKVKSLQQKYDNLIYFRNSERKGRIISLFNAWRQVGGDVFMFMDADLATDLSMFDALRRLVDGIVVHHYDIVTGSRYLRESKTYRPRLWHIISVYFNLAVRFLFRTGIRDHQCGFKAFS